MEFFNFDLIKSKIHGKEIYNLKFKMNQQDISNLIKKTHSNLREKVYHSQGRAEVDEIWSSHVEELFNSEEPVYAEAMETLATQIWDEVEC